MEVIITDKSGRKEINFLGLMQFFWSKWRRILFFGTGVALVVLVYTFFEKNEYQGSIKLLIEEESNSSSMLGQFEGIASIAGIDISAASGLNPEVYEDIIRSTRFQDKLLDTKISFLNYNVKSLREYYERHYSHSFLSKIFQKAKELIFGSNLQEIRDLSDGLIYLPKDKMYQYEDLNERISLEILENGTFTLNFQFVDPLATSMAAKVSSEIVQEFITKYKTEKLRINLILIDESYQSQDIKRQKAQDELSDFLSKNYNLTSPFHEAELNQLKTEVTLQNDLFLSIAKRREETQISLQNQTPTFTVIDYVKVPNEKVYPKRIKLSIISFIVGVFLSIVYFTTILALKQIRGA